MSGIKRYDVNEEWAHSGVVEAGGFVFVNYCVGNVGQPAEAQIRGAFDELETRLSLVGLTLESVVKFDAMFRDIWNIPIMEKVVKERFRGKYPARKSIQTEFAHKGGEDGGLCFQLDAIAYNTNLR
ncbi:MAG: RidA family protein [Clostridiales bacterium]|jgi:enamine deaminase RidA (YjgF/YER057c/UK114 family)|nr:RidA family protein [Clostridiales bacterium]